MSSQAGLDWRIDFKSLGQTIVPPLLGLILLVGVWSAISAATAGSIPTPLDTFQQAVSIFSDPFYRKDPMTKVSVGTS